MSRPRLAPRAAAAVSVVSLASVVVVVASCSDGAVREPVTLIVDADRARGDEDRARLAEMRSGVQQDRAALDKTRQDLSELRTRLEKTLSSEDLVRLQASERALQEQAGCAGASAASDPAALEAMVRRVVVDELAQHDEKLRAAIVADVQGALAGRTATTALAAAAAGTASTVTARTIGLAPSSAPPAPSRDDVRAKFGRVREGVKLHDVVGQRRTDIDALSDRALERLKANDLVGADRLLDEALSLVGG